MSVEGFIAKRKRLRRRGSLYQLLVDESIPLVDACEYFGTIMDVITDEDDAAPLYVVAPPGMRWELVK